MKKNGNWFLVKDCHGVDLEIGDLARLTHNEYHKGNQFCAGLRAKIVDVIMDGQGVRVEVELNNTRIIVSPNRLESCAITNNIALMDESVAINKQICPVCESELKYLNGADYCNSCRMPLWEIQQGLARGFKVGGW